MVGFFSSKKKHERQGFNRYAEEINRYRQSSVAGLPNTGLDRSASLTNSAGSAALAALRNHQLKQGQDSSQSPQQQRSNSMRTYSLNLRSTPVPSYSANQRANSLRTYVYNPSASYVAGSAVSSPRANKPGTINSPGTQRLSSLSSQNSRRVNSLRKNSLTNPKPSGLPPIDDMDIDSQEGTITSTKTTKIQDAQGRVTSITVEIVRTLPDGSSVTETKTKNISRPTSRSNSLTYRAGSLVSQNSLALQKIDELRDFDSDYHDYPIPEAVEIPASNATKSKKLEPISPPAQLTSPFPHSNSNSPKNANPKPLKSILKNSESIKKSVLDASAAAAAAINASQNSPTEATVSEDEEFKDALDVFGNQSGNRKSFIDVGGPSEANSTSLKPQHPYKQRATTQMSPLSKTITDGDSTDGESVDDQCDEALTSPQPLVAEIHSSAAPKKESEYPTSHSSSGSIKFLEKVETIPNKPLKSEEEEMWAAAFKAAEAKVLGDRNSHNNSIPTKKAHPASPLASNKRSMSITSSLVDELKNKKSVSIPDSNTAHLNHHEIDTKGVKDGYEYQNHHRDFKGHSMRDLSTNNKSSRKDRAKEEKKLGKLKAKEEIALEKGEKKKDKKNNRLNSLFSIKRKDNKAESDNEKLDSNIRPIEDLAEGTNQEAFVKPNDENLEPTNLHEIRNSPTATNGAVNPVEYSTYNSSDNKDIQTLDATHHVDSMNNNLKSSFKEPISKQSNFVNDVILPDSQFDHHISNNIVNQNVTEDEITHAKTEYEVSSPKPALGEICQKETYTPKTTEQNDIALKEVADFKTLVSRLERSPMQDDISEIQLKDPSFEHKKASEVSHPVESEIQSISMPEASESILEDTNQVSEPLRNKKASNHSHVKEEEEIEEKEEKEEKEEEEEGEEEEDVNEVREYTPIEELMLENAIKEPSRSNSIADIESSGSIHEVLDSKKRHRYEESGLDEFTMKLKEVALNFSGNRKPDETFESDTSVSASLDASSNKSKKKQISNPIHFFSGSKKSSTRPRKSSRDSSNVKDDLAASRNANSDQLDSKTRDAHQVPKNMRTSNSTQVRHSGFNKSNFNNRMEDTNSPSDFTNSYNNNTFTNHNNDNYVNHNYNHNNNNNNNYNANLNHTNYSSQVQSNNVSGNVSKINRNHGHIQNDITQPQPLDNNTEIKGSKLNNANAPETFQPSEYSNGRIVDVDKNQGSSKDSTSKSKNNADTNNGDKGLNPKKRNKFKEKFYKYFINSYDN